MNRRPIKCVIIIISNTQTYETAYAQLCSNLEENRLKSITCGILHRKRKLLDAPS